MIKYAHQAALYGYLYRRTHEDPKIFEPLAMMGGETIGKKEKIITKRYSLISPDNIFEIFTLMILSGIIGNASYDFLKRIMIKIKKQVGRQKIQKVLEKILKDENEFKKFIRYVKDYYKEKLPKKIKGIIIEEKLVNFLSKLLTARVSVERVLSEEEKQTKEILSKKFKNK